MKRLLGSLALACGVVFSGSAHAGTGAFEAYWIFVGAVKGGYQENIAAARNIEKAVEACGLQADAEPSFKFSNKPDMTFFFVSDYFAPEVHGASAKKKANAVLKQVKKCIPDAYAKKVWYSGE